MKCKPYLLLTAFAASIILISCGKDFVKNDIGTTFSYQPKEIAKGISLGEIYHTYNFAAFTDLAYFKNAWYAVFRAGTEHVAGEFGRIKVLKSTDGITWTVDHIFANDTLDLRDPKLVIDTPRQKMYLNFFGIGNQVNDRINNFSVPYAVNEIWDVPETITYDDTTRTKFIFWRYTYYDNKMYCVAYRVPILGGYTYDNLCMFANNADTNFRAFKNIGRLDLGSSPNETTVRFTDDKKMFLVVRTEIGGTPIGITKPPYRSIQWIKNSLPVRLAAPNFLIYKGKLLITGRDQDDAKLKFFYYDPETKKVIKQYTFPSGYETGYAGMSFNPQNPDELYISYYVITGDNSIIYLAKVNLKTFLQ